MAQNIDVLILDGNQRSALSVTRSLGRLPDLHIAVSDSSPTSLASSSRYCRDYFQSPCPKDQTQAFIGWLSDLSCKHNIRCILPVTDLTTQLLLRNRQVFNNTLIPMGDYDAVMTLADKSQLARLATRLGLPLPNTCYYASFSDFSSPPKRDYPLVFKPSLSCIWTGCSWLVSSVHVIHHPQQLDDLKSREYFEWPFMVQQYIPGHGAAVFALYDHGNPIAFFAHERLREKPPRGGVSVLSESKNLDEQLLAITRTLLDAVKWHGVAMVEFRISPDGRPYLMEVNTRFWGSLQLAIDSGVDFPKLLWQISHDQKPVVPAQYKVGQQLRWLLGDFDSLYLYWCSSQYRLSQKLFRALQFFTPTANRRHEINRLDDLGPAWFELKHYLRALFRSDT